MDSERQREAVRLISSKVTDGKIADGFHWQQERWRGEQDDPNCFKRANGFASEEEMSCSLASPEQWKKNVGNNTVFAIR
ncbi:hypothetical protein ACLOJK_035718 [Asimina triloba]